MGFNSGFKGLIGDESGMEIEAGKTALDVQWQTKWSGLSMKLLSTLRCTLCMKI